MGKYLLSIDGTGYFHSKDVFCENCCEKKDKEGNIVSSSRYNLNMHKNGHYSCQKNIVFVNF
jgi:hypothetical protein